MAPPPTTRMAAAAARALANRFRPRCRGTTSAVGVVDAVSGGSGRTVEMSARIDARRDSGGVSATASAITDVASRRLATSAWQSAHPTAAINPPQRYALYVLDTRMIDCRLDRFLPCHARLSHTSTIGGRAYPELTRYLSRIALQAVPDITRPAVHRVLESKTQCLRSKALDLRF